MINKERINKHCEKLNTLELIEFIQQEVRDLKKYYKQKEKASQKEFNDGYIISRAKSTTNYSNTHNAYRMYFSSQETLNELIKIFNKRI